MESVFVRTKNEYEENNNNNENWYDDEDDVFIISIKRSNEASSILKLK